MGIESVQTTKPYSPVKKTVKRVAVAAAATGTVLYLAKTGKLNPTEGGNKYVETIKKGLKKPADFVLTKAEPIVQKTKDKVLNSGLVKKAAESKPYRTALNLKKAAEPKIKSAVESVKNLHIKDKIKSTVNNAAESIKAVKAKYNPDLASAADKAAETFNNFAG